MTKEEIEEIYKTIGENVTEFRTRAGFTQKELADEIGMARTSISNLESGRHSATVHTLKKIAIALRVELRHILKGVL